MEIYNQLYHIMPFPEKYNPEDANDILRYAKWLVGKTFYDVIEEDLKQNSKFSTVSGYNTQESNTSGVIFNPSSPYGNTQRKGGLGNLIEEHFFHYNANSAPEADFSSAGLELKVTPYEERSSRKSQSEEKYFVAGERLVLTMIDYNHRPIEFDLFKSHLWQKCSKILLVYYLRNKSLGDILKYRIDFVGIFTPNEADLIIIRQDYYLIMGKIASGRAHEISESDTMYLGACTKGSTAAKSIVVQIYNGIPAQKRAFCYKSSYMTTVLNEYFIKPLKNNDVVVTDTRLLSKLGFDGYIQEKISRFIGKSDKEICNFFGLEYSGNKLQWVNIAYAILGIKSNKAEELLKANIKIKATRIEENGSIKENASFPPFKFMDLIHEEWLDTDDEDSNNPSQLQAYFSKYKFLFVVFKKQGKDYILKGSQLWNMPYYDLNVIVRRGWEEIKKTIVEGVKFKIKPVKSGKRLGKFIINNNLPGKHANPIIHIRPHAQKAYYKFGGFEVGNPSDGNILPNGDWMTTQCFWLNNTYIYSILRSDLK